MRLKNRIAIVTGAAGGIGEAVAHLFAQHGAGVMVADLNSVGVSETSKSITDKGGLAHSIEVDVSDVQSVKNLIAQTIEIFETIDILVNVAGVGGFGHFTEVSPDEFDRIMRILSLIHI